MGDDNRSLLCPKDRAMVQSGLIDELHQRIEQLGVPGVDDCLTLLNMLGKLTFEEEREVKRPLTHMVMPLLKDGLGRLVERFCALEPGEAEGERLSDAIQNYAKAISLIANWRFEPCAEAAAPAIAADCCQETAAAEESHCEEAKPAEEPRCAEDVRPAEGPCCAEEVKPAEEPCCAEESKPVEEPCCAEEAKPVEEPCCAEEAKPAEEPCCPEEAAPAEEPCCAEEAVPVEEPCAEDKPSDEPCCGEEKPE